MTHDLALILLGFGFYLAIDAIGAAALSWWERAHPPPPPRCACCGRPVTEHEELREP